MNKIPVNFADVSDFRDTPRVKGPRSPLTIRTPYDLYNQQHYWHAADGWVVVSQMTRRHRINTVNLILLNAELTRFWYLATMPWPNMQGDMAQLLAEEAVEQEVQEINALPAKEWVRSTPLVRRMNLGIDL